MASLGEESIDLSKLGTALFAFGFVLVIGLGIFTIGKQVTNDGSEKVQKQLEIVQQSEFTDYDQKTVLGTKVRAAYSTFVGKEYAILIATNSMVDRGEDGIGLPITDSNWDLVQIKVLDGPGGSQVNVEKADGTTAPLWCINYNSVLEGNEIYVQNGAYIAPNGFHANESTGNVQFFNKVANMSKQGTAEYIPSGSYYQANLIKDTTGNVVGIIFVQMVTG